MKRKSDGKDSPTKIPKLEYTYSPIDTSILKIDFTSVKENKDIVPQFNKIADMVLNKWVINVNNKHYRFSEIEFYLNHKQHPDTFTHGDEMQSILGNWYFHRAGKSYKSGSYKGLDLSFGQGDNSHGGILIRSIQSLEDGSITEGPCLVVNELLKQSNVKEIEELKKLATYYDNFSKVGMLYLVQTDLKKLDVLTSIRVGLSLKKCDKNREYFIKVPYRYTNIPNKISKEKSLIALELVNSKVSLSKISSDIHMPIKKLEEISEQLKSDKSSAEMKDYIGKTLKFDDYVGLVKLRK